MPPSGKLDLAVSPMYEPDLWDQLLLLVIILGIFALATLGFSHRFAMPFQSVAVRHHWAGVLLRPSMIWFGMAMLMLGLRTLLWIRYRPIAAASMSAAPRMTIIIPAYNEGPMVQKTIESCIRASYPRDRLEIIAIDDGSADDTWQHIQNAASHHPGRVRTIRFPENRGKRAALSEGFAQASGEIVVTIDSDSVIEPQALLALAGPFRNPRVAAVAGKVAAFNRYSNLLTRMLHVRFILSFDFLRSVQSTYGTVYCCPGALSAYRTDVVRRVLPGWRDQTFLGAACTFGEDRALTNDILGHGYDAVYQSSAVVHTIVPETYGKLCRMYLRWDRSYIREELRLFRIMWRRPPVALLLTVLEKTLTNLRYPISYGVLAMLAMLSLENPWMLARGLAAIGLASAFYMLYFLRSERSWQFVYGIVYAYFSSLALFWIFPWAMATLRSRSWLTR